MMDDSAKAARRAMMIARSTLAQAAQGSRGADPADLPGFHVKTNHKFASGGDVPQEEEGFEGYHGSPHKFERFDSSKIGTGEGAQAYGYGHYLAENELVARDYRDALAKQSSQYTSPSQRIKIDDLPLESAIRKFSPAISNTSIALAAGSIEKHRGDLQKSYDELNSRDGPLSLGAITAKAIKPFLGKKIAYEPPFEGHMYHVRVRAKPEHFLDWDAPLSEQHPHVENAIADWAAANKVRMGNATGAYVHEAMANALGAADWPINADSKTRAQYRKTAAVKVAQALQAAGIPGIKYWDAGSRAQGQGTRNYVVFDPDMIQVKRRYAAGGTAGDDPMLASGGTAKSSVVEQALKKTARMASHHKK